MTFTGTVKKYVPQDFAEVQAAVMGNKLVVVVNVGGQLQIRFPLAADADSNEVALRVGNIIRQSRLVDEEISVEVNTV